LLKRQFENATALYREYPRHFWTLVGVTFIDRLGGALLFPFFALYITSKFGVGMTEVGILFAFFSVSSFIGTALGGALTDRLGRKGMLIFSLVSTSLSSLIMGFVNTLEAFYLLALLTGIFTDTGGPAHQAMVADLLPEEKRAEGFGIIRVAFNLSVTIGPAIGGILAARSYLLLFITDAVVSLTVAGLVWAYLPETKPEAHPGAKQESMLGTFAGYGRALRDTLFLTFLAACTLMGLVYMNMNTTLGVYLRDVHSVSTAGYGYILSLNAGMVVLFQFAITRRIERYVQMHMMALGSLLYAIGFAMYGFVASYTMFMVAMVIITIGEMVVAPVGQALVAQMAPEDMRGRYMAVFGFSWGISYAIGPLLAGVVLDSGQPNLLWYASGIVGLLAMGMFLYLGRLGSFGRRPAPVMAQDPG
jgi:MFS family permease